MTTTPWRLDPRSKLRPDPTHWDHASPTLRAVFVGQALRDYHIGAETRAWIRVWWIVRGILTNEQRVE